MTKLRNFLKLNFLSTTILIFILSIFITSCGQVQEKKELPKKADKQIEKKKPETEQFKPGGNFNQISDIHFNPFYDETLFEQLKNSSADKWESIFEASKIKTVGTYGDFNEETDYPLLKSSIVNMAAKGGKPDFIIFTGDFLAHIFQDRYSKLNNNKTDGVKEFINKTLTFFTILFEKSFPGVPVYFCLGNNDCYEGDYLIVPEGQFLKNSASIFSVFFKNSDNKKIFTETYPTGGYYTIVPRGNPNTRIISLNNIFFSPKHKSDFNKYNPSDRELQWFEEQLKAAKEKSEKVWVLLHMPPGADVYGIIKKKKYVCDWIDSYHTRFIQLMTDYSDIIKAGFSGHTHMDDFRLLLEDGKQVKALSYVHICPGISTLFGNNPGFELFTYNPVEFSLIDYDVYYINLQTGKKNDTTPAQWAKEYSFKEVYGQDLINPATLNTVYAGIKDSQTMRGNYKNYYDVNQRKALTDSNWKYYWCAIGQWTEKDYNNCQK